VFHCKVTIKFLGAETMRRQMRQSFGNVVARNAVALKLYAFA
jgi:hypothetical protein